MGIKHLAKTQFDNLEILNRDLLKLIALIFMMIWHTAAYFQLAEILEFNAVWDVLSAISLFAPPVFFFFVSQGYIYTHSKSKYALRLFVFAVITQVPFALVNYGTVFTLNILRNLNILFTLFAGFIAIIVWESGAKLATRLILIILIDALTAVLRCEWMFFGVLIILIMHIFREEPKKRTFCFAICNIIVNFALRGVTLYTLISPGFIAGTLSMFAGYFCATVLYNGKNSKFSTFAKWFFYIAYPIHFAIIYFLICFFDIYAA